MDNTKEMSKIAFNQQALTYDKEYKRSTRQNPLSLHIKYAKR